jgi:hypothetical protein
MRAATSRAASLILAALVAGCAAGSLDSAAAGASTAPAGQGSPVVAATASPSAVPAASPTVASTVSPAVAPTASPFPGVSPGPQATPTEPLVLPPAPTDWHLDLYSPYGMRFEYPDPYACTATSVQITLNFIVYDGGAADWTPTTSYATQQEIFAYERANMTLPAWANGSDPHGARNAINYYGWGSLKAGVYKDVSFGTFRAAAKAVVSSIARTRRPAIIFPWYGGHAQVVTGYKAHGEDPATSDSFTVEGVYLTDPLVGYTYIVYGGASHRVDAIRPDTYVSLATWQYGPDAVRYTDFRQTDSTIRDPIDGAIGRREWFGKWVAVLAVI